MNACNGCKNNDTHTVQKDISEYADAQLSIGNIFCRRLGWVIPCIIRQPSCGAP